MACKMCRGASQFRSVALAYCVAGALLVGVGGAGCAKPEIVDATSHEATLPAQVKIYQKPPAKKYEILGIVTANRAEGAKWDNRGDANMAFDTMLKKAADKGANGLLLEATGESTGRVTAGYHGQDYEVPIRGNPPEGMAKAIYVREE
jgi:hypothetical protein